MINYTVVRNDNLWNIAIRHLGNGLRWKEIANLNGINVNNPIIYPGQVLKINTGGGGTPPSAKTNASKAVLQYFGLQAGTETSVFVTWTWSKGNTEHYRVIWQYDTGNGVWFTGTDTTTKEKQSVYSAPNHANRVRVRVQPISQKREVNKKQVAYWSAQWSTYKTYNFKDNPPSKPPTPTVSIDKYNITATLANLDINATDIQFQVVRDAASTFKTATVKINRGAVSYSCPVTAGSKYTVRARGQRGKIYGEWSEYSNAVETIPSVPTGITDLRSVSATSVYLSWNKVNNATTYDIEYATERRFLGASDSSRTVNGIESLYYELTGLESGNEYFFRIRATNNQGSSGWSGIKSVIIGKKPAPPTTWSSSSTVITGEQLVLYWVHNSEDGSSQKYGEVEVTTNGNKQTYTVRNTEDEDERDNTSFYNINTSTFTEGTTIRWRVRTSGVTTQYGDWSVMREINIYAPPTLNLQVTDVDNTNITTLTRFPMYIRATAGPNTQRPIGYHLSVIPTESYTTVDAVGRQVNINANEAIFDRHYDINNQLVVQLSASNIDLENNIEYRVLCVVSMDSGLTAEDETTFTVAWTDEQFEPNAEIGYDPDTFSSYIQPWARDEDDELIPNLLLSVYRREFDGTFTEIITGLQNNGSGYATDPHPSLDYARYRIVAVEQSTGAVSFYDPPGYPVNEKAVIIQWDEDWKYFEVDEDAELDNPPWTGSLVQLPYNIDVNDNYAVDVAHVEYIGREHPVSYYGTQIGETASWSVDIVKSDEETLYAVRRLARWTGDVYVREPSGTGYWATLGVSLQQDHTSLVIPVSLDITRVEGGM